MLGDKYTVQERNSLLQAIPEELRADSTFGLYLDYGPAEGKYFIRIRQPGKPPRTIHTIPREQMKNWTNPKRVMSHVARRALKDAGFTVDFRKP